MATNLLLPLSYGTPVGTTSAPVLPSNPSRTALVFVNTSVSVAVAITPAIANIAAVQGVFPGGTASTAAINGAGSITMQPNDKFIIDTLACTCAWNGIAGGSGGTLTVLES